MTSIPGYDAHKLASPPETNGPERCRDCREELCEDEIAEELCAPCIKLRSEDMNA